MNVTVSNIKSNSVFIHFDSSPPSLQYLWIFIYNLSPLTFPDYFTIKLSRKKYFKTKQKCRKKINLIQNSAYSALLHQKVLKPIFTLHQFLFLELKQFLQFLVIWNFKNPKLWTIEVWACTSNLKWALSSFWIENISLDLVNLCIFVTIRNKYLHLLADFAGNKSWLFYC